MLQRVELRKVETTILLYLLHIIYHSLQGYVIFDEKVIYFIFMYVIIPITFVFVFGVH